MQDELIGAVYDAPFENPPWSTTLPKLRTLTGANRLMLKFSPAHPEDSAAIYTDSTIRDEEWNPNGPNTMYRRIYQWKDPIQYNVMAEGEVRRLDELIDVSTYKASDYYRELCAPFGIENAFYGYLGRRGGRDAWLKGSRDDASGPFTAQEVSIIRSLLPHLSRSVAIQYQMEKLQTQSVAYAQTVASLGVGMIMLDYRGNIVEANAEAKAILATANSIRQYLGRLCITAPTRGLTPTALDTRQAGFAARSETMIADDGQTPVNIMVRPATDVIPAGGSSSIAFIAYLDRGNHPLTQRAADFVAHNYGLSRAEARLCILLANGHTLETSAVELGITPTTARTYCKRAFAKTGTTRQAELVRLLLNSLARLS